MSAGFNSTDLKTHRELLGSMRDFSVHGGRRLAAWSGGARRGMPVNEASVTHVTAHAAEERAYCNVTSPALTRTQTSTGKCGRVSRSKESLPSRSSTTVTTIPPLTYWLMTDDSQFR